MLQRQFSQLKTKHFRYPIFFPISINISKMPSHQNAHKTENSFWLDKRKRMFLSASGTKKHLLPGLKQQRNNNLILKLALLRQIVNRLKSSKGTSSESYSSWWVNFRTVPQRTREPAKHQPTNHVRSCWMDTACKLIPIPNLGGRRPRPRAHNYIPVVGQHSSLWLGCWTRWLVSWGEAVSSTGCPAARSFMWEEFTFSTFKNQVTSLKIQPDVYTFEKEGTRQKYKVYKAILTRHTRDS